MASKTEIIVIDLVARHGYYCTSKSAVGRIVGIHRNRVRKVLVEGDGFHNDGRWLICYGSADKPLPRGKGGFKF